MTDSKDVNVLARAWALTLTAEVYRAGLLPGSPLVPLLQQRQFTAGALLSLAPEGALRQLRDLHKVAKERLLPTILPATRIDLGPTFDGSTLCPADADIIHDGQGPHSTAQRCALPTRTSSTTGVCLTSRPIWGR